MNFSHHFLPTGKKMLRDRNGLSINGDVIDNRPNGFLKRDRQGPSVQESKTRAPLGGVTKNLRQFPNPVRITPPSFFRTIIFLLASRKCSARSRDHPSKRLKSGPRPLMATASSSLKTTKSDSSSALRTRWFTDSPIQQNTMTVVCLLSGVPIPSLP